MIDAELLRMVRRIDVRARRALKEPFAGLARSTLKGRGLAFEEVRAYSPGDDVRDIDWKVTARTGSPYVKKYSPERERTIWLLVDDSASMKLASGQISKRQRAVEVSALLALSAASNQDRTGLASFGGRQRLVRPERGRRHAVRLVRDLLAEQPDATFLPLDVTVTTLRRVARRRSLVFVISDFLFERAVERLSGLCRRHELVAIHVRDRWEQRLPTAGLVRWRDAETGRECIVDTSNSRYRQAYEEAAAERERRLRRELARRDIRWVPIWTDRSPALSLIRHLGRR